MQSKSKKKDKLIKGLRSEIVKLQRQLGIAPEEYPGDGDVGSRIHSTQWDFSPSPDTICLR